jgi:phage gp45-like
MMDLRRFDFDGTIEESGGQQFVSGRAMKGDGFTRIHRVEPHGFMSNPPAGSKGVVLSPHPDQSYVLGLEHPSHRPKDLPGGAVALYDASGNIIKMVMGDGVRVSLTGGTFEVSRGGCLLKVSSAGVDITGGYLKVNGVRVDETHIHTGVVPGGGNTGTPAG